MPELSSLYLSNDANLRSYWKLENVNDSTANGYNLTNTGSTPFNAALFGNGADLGTSNGSRRLSISSNLGINGNSDATFSFWFKLQTEIGSGEYSFFRHHSTGGSDRRIQLSYRYNSGTRGFYLPGGSGTYNITLGTTDYYHAVVTRNSTTTKLYLNAVEVISDSTISGTAGSNDFWMGSNEIGGDYTSAIFDDWACFNRELTAGEVRTIFSGGGGGFLLNFV